MAAVQICKMLRHAATNTTTADKRVVFGNLRVKALKALATSSVQNVRMTCIVQDMDLRRRFVTMDLLAKFLDAASADNNGEFAQALSTLQTQSANG